MHDDSDKTRGIKGVTLVEMVLAISMMTIILGAVLPLFAGIRNSWSTKQASAEITQNARVLTDHLHRSLSQAVRITDVSASSAEAGHIEFTGNDGSSYRYALADGFAQFGPVGEPADLAGPISQFQITCYDGNDFTTPTVDPTAIRLVAVEIVFPNPTPLGQEKSFTTSVYLRPGTMSEADVSLPEAGVAIKNSIAWGGNGMDIDSYRSSQGSYDSAKPGAEAVVSVNATGYGKITLWTRARIRGDVYIGPGGDPDLGIKTWGGSEITGTRGTLTNAVDMTKASAPSGSPFEGNHEGSVQLWGTQTETIDSDHHFNKIQLWGQSKLIIDGRVTLLLNNVFQIGDSAELRLLPDSSLTMYVNNSCGIWGSARLNDSTKEPSRLRIHIIGNNKALDMTSDAIVHAVVKNPSGRVSIWSRAQLFGKIKAAQLLGGGRIHVDLDCGFDTPSQDFGQRPTDGGGRGRPSTRGWRRPRGR